MRYILAALTTALLVAGGTVWWMLANVNTATTAATNQTPVTLTVVSGEKLRTVANALQQAQLIPSASAWVLYAVLQGQRSGVLAGTYVLGHDQSGKQLLRTLTTSQEKSNEVTVKIREGLISNDVAALLDQAGVISSANFLAAVSAHDSRLVVPNKTYGFLADKPASANLEGYLFPDTYRFFKKSTAAEVLQKFLDNFEARVGPDLRQTAADHHRTLYQEIIMGSILEAELKSDADRAMAADIFWRRANAGMGLNADTTILYALGVKNKTLTNADLQVDSPYNTYTHQGLPPGPIDNPGLSAIRAAINPTPNDSWYYLTATDGQTVFAKTLAEQNQNKLKYLQ